VQAKLAQGNGAESNVVQASVGQVQVPVKVQVAVAVAWQRRESCR